MTEGWNNDNYVILFDSTEQNHVSEAYGINQLLPHHTILGLSGWDDFIVQNDKGKLFNIPTGKLYFKR